MRLFRHLQHWLTGHGIASRSPILCLQPSPPPMGGYVSLGRPGGAIEHSFAQRFPKDSNRGRLPVSPRVLLALELLKHEVGASDEAICHRLRTDFAVMYACGIEAIQLDSAQEHFVLPEMLAQFRSALTKP